jgi:hypothetical protein
MHVDMCLVNAVTVKVKYYFTSPVRRLTQDLAACSDNKFRVADDQPAKRERQSKGCCKGRLASG